MITSINTFIMRNGSIKTRNVKRDKKGISWEVRKGQLDIKEMISVFNIGGQFIN